MLVAPRLASYSYSTELAQCTTGCGEVVSLKSLGSGLWGVSTRALSSARPSKVVFRGTARGYWFELRTRALTLAILCIVCTWIIRHQPISRLSPLVRGPAGCPGILEIYFLIGDKSVFFFSLGPKSVLLRPSFAAIKFLFSSFVCEK